jgi:teichuronic acid biosynthesis glycosyltransferase TuaC
LRIHAGIISHLFPTKKRPGFGVFVRDELDALSKDVDIRLVAPLHNQYRFELGATDVSQFSYMVIRPFVFAFPRYFMQKYYPDSMALTLRLNRRFLDGIDIIHAHNAFPEGVAAINVFGDMVPVTVTVHGSDINVFAMKKSLKPVIVKTMNRASSIISVSNALKKTLREIGVTSRIDVIPNGLDTAIFTPGNKKDASLSLGLDPLKKRIIFIGNFSWIKGVEYLIRAFPGIMKKNPGCELLLLGARPQSTDLISYKGEIEKTGVAEFIKIIPQVPHKELPLWLRASDVLALPSVKEGFGIVAAEALSCGIPVVSTLSGGPEDIVTEGLGYLVPPCDPEALGEALSKALNGEGIISSEAISSSSHERFSFEEVSHRIIDIYKSLI